MFKNIFFFNYVTLKLLRIKEKKYNLYLFSNRP